MKRFEYEVMTEAYVVSQNTVKDSSGMTQRAKIENGLNQLGKKGWELVHRQDIPQENESLFYFKREKK